MRYSTLKEWNERNYSRKSLLTASAYWRTVFDLAKKKKRIEDIEKELERPDAWEDTRKAGERSRELAEIKKDAAEYEDLQKRFFDIQELQFLDSPEDDMARELAKQIAEFTALLGKAEYAVFLGGPYDRGDALLAITAGAGGQDAQDWATILCRMYQRYADGKGWKAEELDHSWGEQGAEGRVGTKQASFEIQGRYAYGFLKRESGVHRLVRMSPFSAKALRHTSFASVEVLPKIDMAKEKDIVMKEDDLRVDTFNASGPGGQNVNKRETAIRVTHISTGIVVTCQSQRSQQQNKEKAMEILAAKLYQRRLEAQEKELTVLRGEKKLIEWGSQVRSYVLAPYQMVKDHRTDVETSQVDKVLN